MLRALADELAGLAAGQTGIAQLEPDPISQLHALCIERGYWLSQLDEVRTEAAAELIGVSAQWLRMQAC